MSDKKLAWKRSFTLFWFDKSIEVLRTFLAFFENHKVTTITKPAKIRIRVGDETFEERKDILKSSGLNPETFHSVNDCQAAIGTPMKFTRSFPAKASARENVPTIIIVL